jgi:hypothetical protein
MKRIKEKKEQKLTSNVGRTLKHIVVNDFAEEAMSGISESKAVEILVTEALKARGLMK